MSSQDQSLADELTPEPLPVSEGVAPPPPTGAAVQVTAPPADAEAPAAPVAGDRPDREQVLAEAQAELDRQEQQFEAGLDAHDASMRKHLGGMYTGPDRMWRNHLNKVEAEMPAESAGLGSHCAVEEEGMVLDDEHRAERDEQLVDAAEPGSELAEEASHIVAEEKKDADDAMGGAMEVQLVAAGAHADVKRKDPTSSHAAEDSAEKLLGQVSHDLADADKALAQLEADMRKDGIEPPPAD